MAVSVRRGGLRGGGVAAGERDRRERAARRRPCRMAARRGGALRDDGECAARGPRTTFPAPSPRAPPRETRRRSGPARGAAVACAQAGGAGGAQPERHAWEHGGAGVRTTKMIKLQGFFCIYAYPLKGYGPKWHNLTSLECQISILRVCGPKWHLGTSSRTAGVFNSIYN